MDYDIVIRNGLIIDGTGNPWYKADIGILDEKIAKMSPTPLKHADSFIESKGLMVCPGFVNLHSHTDSTILIHNRAENCLAMGLVTELTGNCGFSSAPITESHREVIKNTWMSRSLISTDEDIDWLSMNEWMKKVEEKGTGVNVASMVGHGTIRSCVMGREGEGGERTVPTSNEMEEMRAMVDAAMSEGAFGFSTGLVYPPGRNAESDEVIELCKVVAKYGGVYTSHLRSEGDKLIEAVQEFIETCKRAGVRGAISHHKTTGMNNYGKVCETIRMVERARSRGIDIIIDQYPWEYGGGVNKSLGIRFKSPKGIRTREELVEKLKDPVVWEKLKATMQQGKEQGGVILCSKTHPELEGKSLEEATKALGARDLWEGIRKLLIDDEGYTYAGGEPFSEDDIITILKYPWTAVSTDLNAMDNSKVTLEDMADVLAMQHPRGWGTYAKILGRYVRDENVLTLEEAVRKMTSLPANFMGLQNRGIVREGFYADLVIFDPETVENLATYKNPRLSPKGIPYVLVNGQLAIEKNKHTGTLSGKVLRCNE